MGAGTTVLAWKLLFPFQKKTERMGMTRSEIITGVASLLILQFSGIGCSDRRGSSDTEAREACQARIQALLDTIRFFEGETGNLPSSVEEAMRYVGLESMLTEGQLSCPAAVEVFGVEDAAYFYVDWRRRINREIPNNYPLVYELYSGLHGNGINVGLVNGQVFWDEQCSWITEFIIKHEEYELPPPKQRPLNSEF